MSNPRALLLRINTSIDILHHCQRPVEWPRKYVTKTFLRLFLLLPRYMTTMQRVLKVAVCFLRVKVYSQHTTAKTQWHKWSDEVGLCDWGLFANEDATSNIKFKFRQIRPNRQDAIALDYCAMHEWFNKLEFRLLLYIHVDNISTQT